MAGLAWVSPGFSTKGTGEWQGGFDFPPKNTIFLRMVWKEYPQKAKHLCTYFLMLAADFFRSLVALAAITIKKQHTPG